MELLPCPFCGNKHIQFLGNSLCEIYGDSMAEAYCSKCQAKTPKKVWNKRKLREDLISKKTDSSVVITLDNDSKVELVLLADL
tara:strand:- start:347 stop:595 length:249 start_codon:yes stop_codon:yes gene_type:complete